MARKSRKQPFRAAMMKVWSTVGYIRLSVANKDESCSVENQKLLIEQWGVEHEMPINHFYIDANHSVSNFNRPAFKQMLVDPMECTMKLYEQLILKELDKDTYLAKKAETELDANKRRYEELEAMHKVLHKKLPLAEIWDCIDSIVVSEGRKIEVKWREMC